MKKMRFICTALLACSLTGAVWADLEPIKGNTGERLDSLEKKTGSVLAKAGILFGGEFYSRAFSSKIEGELTTDAAGNIVGKTTENILATGLDLSIEARPLDAVGGKAIIRMYQDWRNMFGSMANPLTLRWISINGNVKNIFTYDVGDFKQRYTKFTLWTPEPDIMFEPTIFARQREITMGEEFLGDNNRVMQGMNFNFGAKVAPAFQELRLNAFFSRQRQAGTEKEISGTPDATNHLDVNMDRYATAFNTDMKFVPGTSIGGTVLYVGDAKRTSRVDESKTWKTATNDLVFSGRARLGSELFAAIDTNAVIFGLSGEFAASNYTWYGGKDIDTTLFGTAFKGNLDGNFKFGANGLKLNAGFLANSYEFRNEMAQSPALFNRRILNTSLGTDKNTYNIFDALYTSVFSYIPGQGEFGIKQPVKKSAWTRSTLTWSEIASEYKKGLIEQNLSGALPLGEATPNRSGILANLDLDFANKAILLGGKLNILSEITNINFADSILPDMQSFMEFGGGASFDIAKFGNWWAYPFILSGSYSLTSVDNYQGTLDMTNNVSFVNAGLYWKFWKRMALMGGYQIVESTAKEKFEMTTNQSQWAAGLEYTVAEGGVLNATIGQVMVDYSATDAAANENAIKGNFKSLRLDLNLTVKF